MKCPECGCTQFDENPARGDMVCTECGAVASENAVTASIEYVENTGGTSTAIGRFVSDESQMPGYRESRYATEQKARRRIETICGQLRLGPDVGISAFRYYQSALFRGLTRGRNAMQLAAACIYVAARQLRVNLMLLDLSDAVAINVYTVGRTYIELKKKLNLSLPEIDPCLFVERFASQLDFEDKTTLVATTAMRLLQRMKRDWISTGRRPSGLAAASLLVAARIHEFNRTEEDVAKVARISHMTARKRLAEFSKTPSSALSIDAFFTVDYDEETDPPAFGQSLVKRRFDIQDFDMTQVSVEIKELGRRIDTELDKLSQKQKTGVAINNPDIANSRGLKHLVADISNNDDTEAGQSSGPSQCKKPRSSREILRNVLDGVVDPDILDSCVEDLQIITTHSGIELCDIVKASQHSRDAAEAAKTEVSTKSFLENDAATDESDAKSLNFPMDRLEHVSTLIPTDESLKLPHFITPLQSSSSNKDIKADASQPMDMKGCAIDLSCVDEEELDREYFLAPAEVMVKATFWFRENASFLEEQRRKKAEKQRLKEELAKQPKKIRRGSRKIYQRVRRMPWHTGGAKQDQDDETSTNQEKPVMSKKINYAALEAIVSGDKPSKAVSVPPPPEDQPNRLLESTLVSETSVAENLFATSASSPALLEKTSTRRTEEVEPEEFTVETSVADQEGEEEFEEEEEEEVVDWNEGEDLW